MARNSLGITEISTVSITPPGLWYSRDDLGARGLIRFGAALLPVAQRADRDVEARRELLLAEAQSAANDLRPQGALHPVHIFFRERSRVGPRQLGRAGLLAERSAQTCLRSSGLPAHASFSDLGLSALLTTSGAAAMTLR